MALNIPPTDRKRIVVVGGGFAGITLARNLSRRLFQVVLIDRNNYHQFQPLLYQVATSSIKPGDIAFPFRKIFRHRRNVHFRMAEVTGVLPRERTVETTAGSLAYDYLVLATGSVTNFYGMEGVEAGAFPMKDLTDALAIRNQILLSLEKASLALGEAERRPLFNVVVVGGGLSGVELVGALAEMKRYILPKDYPDLPVDQMNIMLVEGSDRLLPTMHPDISARAERLLGRMGVRVILNTQVTDYRAGRVIFKDGSFIPSRNLVWTSGVRVEPIEGIDERRIGPGGRIQVDRFNRVAGYSRIFAVGDAAMARTDDHPKGYPQVAREAIEEARHLVRNLEAHARGEGITGYTYHEYPTMAAIGRNKAFVQFKRFRMGGFMAWLAWAVVHIAFVLGVQNKLSIFIGWAWNYLTYDQPNRIIVRTQASRRPRPSRDTLREALTDWKQPSA
ncbi:MAG: NAD(P)/FAD-dependent oxidoreductase [Rikenellaceae bacterium]|nr:NAD(P)/FAD-dependent oxidoreductase [Rikenellaceae bacterium]